MSNIRRCMLIPVLILWVGHTPATHADTSNGNQTASPGLLSTVDRVLIKSFDGLTEYEPWQEKLFSRYASRQHRIETGRIYGRGTTTVATLGVTLSKGPIAGAAVGLAMAEGVSLITGRMEKLSQDILADQLARYRQETNDADFTELYDLYELHDRSPEAFFKKLFQHPSPVYSANMENLDADGRAIANTHLVNVLQDQIVKGTLEQRLRDSSQDTSIAAVAGSYFRIVDELTSYKGITDAAIEDLQKNQKGLQKSVKDLNTKVLANQQAVFQLQKIAFAKMSPSERLEIAKSGSFANLLSEAEISALETEARQQDLNESAKNYLDQVGHIGTILENLSDELGLAPEQIRPVKQALSFGQAAFKAYLAFQGTSPDVLSGVSAISSLFGGGTDASTVRHQEVMAQLDRLLAGQEKILNGVRTVIDNQNKILETVTKVGEILSRQMSDNHNALMEKLEIIERKQDIALRGITEILSSKIDTCDQLVDRFTSARETLGRPVPYHVGAQILNSGYHRRALCFSGILEVTDLRQNVDSVYHLRSDPDASIFRKSPIDFDLQVFQPALGLLIGMMSDELDATEGIARFEQAMTPRLTFSALAAPNPEGTSGIDVDCRDPFNFGCARSKDERLAMMETPINPQRVLVDANAILTLFRYLDIPSTSYPEYTKLAREASTYSYWEGELVLRNLLDIVNVTIAQQALISGGPLLRFAQKCLQEDCAHVDINSLLDNNPLLSSNLASYIVHRALVANSTSLLPAYRIAYEARDTVLLQAIFDREWNIVEKWLDPLPDTEAGGQNEQTRTFDGWTFHASGRAFSLPIPTDVLSDEVQYTPAFWQLVEFRDRARQILMDYDFVASLPLEDRNSLVTLVLGK